MNHKMIRQLDEDGVPRPDGTPLGNLRHTLAVYADDPNDREVLTATSNVYGHRVRTGITLGDLRALLEELS